jgi:hypothetical protein
MQIPQSSSTSSVKSFSTSVAKLEQDQARSEGEAESKLIEDAGSTSKAPQPPKNADGVGNQVDLSA